MTAFCFRFQAFRLHVRAAAVTANIEAVGVGVVAEEFEGNEKVGVDAGNDDDVGVGGRYTFSLSSSTNIVASSPSYLQLLLPLVWTTPNGAEKVEKVLVEVDVLEVLLRGCDVVLCSSSVVAVVVVVVAATTSDR